MIEHSIFARSNTILSDQNACLLCYIIMEEGLEKILLVQNDRANKFCLIIRHFARSYDRWSALLMTLIPYDRNLKIAQNTTRQIARHIARHIARQIARHIAQNIARQIARQIAWLIARQISYLIARRVASISISFHRLRNLHKHLVNVAYSACDSYIPVVLIFLSNHLSVSW